MNVGPSFPESIIVWIRWQSLVVSDDNTAGSIVFICLTSQSAHMFDYFRNVLMYILLLIVLWFEVIIMLYCVFHALVFRKNYIEVFKVIYMYRRNTSLCSSTLFLGCRTKNQHYLNNKLRYSYLQQMKVGVFSYIFKCIHQSNASR